MSTYTQILYQIVFSTKHRKPTLLKANRRRLYQCIYGVLKNNNCHVYRINGVEDHLHIITHLHPSVALASLIKDIKLGSTDFIKSKQLFPKFGGWQRGYGAFTYKIEARHQLIEYVKNQESHHVDITYKEELRGLLLEHGVAFEERYLE